MGAGCCRLGSLSLILVLLAGTFHLVAVLVVVGIAVVAVGRLLRSLKVGSCSVSLSAAVASFRVGIGVCSCLVEDSDCRLGIAVEEAVMMLVAVVRRLSKVVVGRSWGTEVLDLILYSVWVVVVDSGVEEVVVYPVEALMGARLA